MGNPVKPRLYSLTLFRNTPANMNNSQIGSNGFVLLRIQPPPPPPPPFEAGVTSLLAQAGTVAGGFCAIIKAALASSMPVPQVAVSQVEPAGNGCALLHKTPRTASDESVLSTSKTNAATDDICAAVKLVPCIVAKASPAGASAPKLESVNTPSAPSPPGALRSTAEPKLT